MDAWTYQCQISSGTVSLFERKTLSACSLSLFLFLSFSFSTLLLLVAFALCVPEFASCRFSALWSRNQRLA